VDWNRRAKGVRSWRCARRSPSREDMVCDVEGRVVVGFVALRRSQLRSTDAWE
jgi:hypothetical protein